MTISKETLSLINAFKNPLIEMLSDIKDEVKFYFDTGIIKYVDSIQNKFSKTKTFLYRLENVNFYDTYFPISIKNEKIKEFTPDNVEELFQNSNYISIIGNAGSGKSMLLKHIFLKSIMQIVKIPIVIELRNLNDFVGTFFEYLDGLLAGKKITPNKKILDRILSNGEFLFLFDGYDEIYSNNKNRITSEIIDFIDNYSKNYFLITSRPGANVESLPRFDSFSVNDLTITQVKEFTQLQLKNCGDAELANKIISVIEKPENIDYQSFLLSPLLLSMFIMTFNSYPELPKSKSKFYWNVYDTLCTKHDSFTKYGGYQHERKTGLQNEEFENVLKWFAYISLFKGKYSFDEQFFTNLLKSIKEKLLLKCSISDLKEDLTVAISIIVVDGLEYKFPHKSLQEYFAVLLIKEQKDSVKKEIYTNKFDHFLESTLDDNYNMMSLCSEIDNIVFKKYFILRHLKDFINKDFSSNEKACNIVMEIGGCRMFYQENGGKKTIMATSIEGSIQESVLSFVGIMIMDVIDEIYQIVSDKLFEINDITPYLINIKSPNECSLSDLNKKITESFLSIKQQNQIGAKILKYVTKARLELTKMTNEIKSFEKRNSELLEL